MNDLFHGRQVKYPYHRSRLGIAICWAQIGLTAMARIIVNDTGACAETAAYASS